MKPPDASRSRCGGYAVEEDGKNYYAATVSPSLSGSVRALGSRSDGENAYLVDDLLGAALLWQWLV